jgi:hypothetical protein
MPTDRNRLRNLAGKFEALPRQKELKQTKFQLATITSKATEHAGDLSRSFGRIAVLRDVHAQQDLLRAEIRQQVKSLRSIAQTLDQQVRPGGQSSKLTTALDSLSKVTKSVSDSISQAWTAGDNETLETTQALIELTGKYDLTAQRALQQALARFKLAGTPSSPEAVAAYREARDALVNARMALNIPGVVGKFLGDAARGMGSVKAIADPEIQSFLNEHPELWSRLTVKLG